MTKQDYTHISLLLDRSGSMSIIEQDTVGGINSFVADQAKLPGHCTMSLVKFDSANKQEVVFDWLDIKSVKPILTIGPRGNTPLRDAIGELIVTTGEKLSKMDEKDRPSKVIICIVTDGHENASTEYSGDQIKQMVKEQTEKYGWNFVYLGANQDAVLVGGALGVARDSSLSYAANSVGTQSMYAAASRATKSLRSGESQVMCFSDQEREAQALAGAAV